VMTDSEGKELPQKFVLCFRVLVTSTVLPSFACQATKPTI
jgi:hypothetical protein